MGGEQIEGGGVGFGVKKGGKNGVGMSYSGEGGC